MYILAHKIKLHEKILVYVISLKVFSEVLLAESGQDHEWFKTVLIAYVPGFMRGIQ